MIKLIRIPIIRCSEGIYLRWYFNGWHYFLFTNGYEVTMQTENADTMVTKKFSVISRIERATMITAKYSYTVGLEGITKENIGAFTGVLMAEMVEQYENEKWYEVDITRGAHTIKEEGAPGYIFEFEITRKELPNAPSVFQKSQFLYLGDQLCDLDDDEMIPINKQVNDVAEMKDRQSDFTGTFKIRKTRAMRLLFELSGDAGANTTFPYKNQPCRLVQNNIEIITAGIMTLTNADDQYYYVSILSGNLNFFNAIDKLKITDLLLPSTNHIWAAVIQAASNAGNLDYVYPLCEPSDDGGIAPLTDDGDRVEMFGGWIWPFIKIRAIWNEIFTNAAYFCAGKILDDDIFNSLFMPVSNLNLSNVDIKPWLYSLHAINHKVMNASRNALDTVYADVTCILGDSFFKMNGRYITRYAASYTIRVVLKAAGGSFYLPSHVYLYNDAVQVAEFKDDGTYHTNAWLRAYTVDYTTTALDTLRVVVTTTGLAYYDIQVTGITAVKIAYLSNVEPHFLLPDISQTDFLKMICNLFGLIPEAVPRDKKIKFWNYSELYDNIPIARDWSEYLSEAETDCEFKFGDYAQRNNLKYNDSSDVIKNNGNGVIQIDDETLPAEKDVVQIPVSTCDEVKILIDVNVSRIAFNISDGKTPVTYVQKDSIDPRIVYVSRTKVSAVSPLYEKTFGIRTAVSGGTSYDTITPQKASSIEVAFSLLNINYAALSRMLTKTNLRNEKFNLPVYEVAGLKHYIPIYLRQFSAYFYVNKITNYVPGHLCTVELVKL